MTNTEITESSLVEGLSQADEYLVRLQQLPSKQEFKNKIEQKLWRTVTAELEPETEIPYTHLPEIARSLIGTYESEEGSAEPWWLTEFDWKVSSGSTKITLRGEDLETFSENFDRDLTQVHKPELRKSSGFVLETLDALKNIQSWLESHIDVSTTDASFPELPDEVFIVKEGRIELTNEFDDWIDEFLELSPGIGPEATALYLAHTGTSREAAETALGEELFEYADRVGSFGQVNASNSPYQPRPVIEFDKVLKLSSVFNRTIDAPERLYGLQYQLYRGFLEVFDPQDDYTRGLFRRITNEEPERLEDGEEARFTRVACGTPVIRYADRRPKLMSVSMYSPKSGDEGYQVLQYRALKSLFQEYDWFHA